MEDTAAPAPALARAGLPGGGGMGLLALLGGQWVTLFLLHEFLTGALHLRQETAALRVLPGLVWPLGLAWLVSAWQARRRRRSTALPLGFHLASALWLTATVLVPVYRQALAHRLDADAATVHAWSAGVALTALTGGCQLLLAPLADRLLALWSADLALALGAFTALASAALLVPFLTQYSLLAVVGLLSLFVFLPLGLPRPFGWSAGGLALGAGLVVQLSDRTVFDVPAPAGSLLPNWDAERVGDSLHALWLQPEFLLAALPLLLGTLARDLILLREARATEGEGRARGSLVALGLLNIGGSLVGCGLPLGLLPGFPGFRRMAAGQVYSQGAGLLLTATALLGWLPTLISWAPLPTLGVLTSATMLLAAGGSLNRLSAGSGYVLAAAALPFWLAQQQGSEGVTAPSTLPLALVWGGIATCLLRRHYAAGVWACLAAALLAASGLLHHARWSWDFDPVAGAYLTLGAVFHLAFVFQSAAPWAAPPPPRQAPAEEEPDPSNSRASLSSSDESTLL